MRVQNARVLMVKGFIRIIVDKWAILKPADEPLEVEPKLDRDRDAARIAPMRLARQRCPRLL